MDDAPGRGGEITMMDGVAMVTGAAVASVHFRDFTDEVAALTLPGWLLLIVAFAWLSVTSAGPFVYLVRRFSHRTEGYPGPWDGVWVAFGIPWLLAGLVRSGAGSAVEEGNAIYSGTLFSGLFLASGLALRRLLLAWPPASTAAPVAPPEPAPIRSWTGRIGRALSIGWPLQLGLGLVVTK